MWPNNKINMIAFKWFEYMIIYLLNILSCLCNHRLSDDTHTHVFIGGTHTHSFSAIHQSIEIRRLLGLEMTLWCKRPL